MNRNKLPACQRLAAEKIKDLIDQAVRGGACADLWAGIAGYARLAQAEAAAHDA